jgi:AcrR family transcriptional regulator
VHVVQELHLYDRQGFCANAAGHGTDSYRVVSVRAYGQYCPIGYAGATIRDIARRAGVTHGLVMMHFTSKEQLFLAAVPGHRELAEVLAGDPSLLPERVAAAYVERMEKDPVTDPLVILLRSAASNVEAATRLYAAMQANSVDLYRDMLPGKDPAARVELLGAQLIGVTFSRYIVRSGRLAQLSPDELRDYLIPVLRNILLG